MDTPLVEWGQTMATETEDIDGEDGEDGNEAPTEEESSKGGHHRRKRRKVVPDLRNLAARLPAPLALALLGASLLENPGVTAPTPSLTLCAAGVLAVVVALCLPFAKPRTGWAPAVSWVALALLGWCGLSALTSLAPYLSSTFNASLVGFTAILVAFQVSIQGRRNWHRATITLVLWAALICCYGLYRMFAEHHRLQATFTNPDCFSVIPLVGAFLSLGLVSSPYTSQKRPRWLVLTTFFSLCLVLTGARSGMVGFLAGYAVFVFTIVASADTELDNKRRRKIANRQTDQDLLPLYLLPPLLGVLLLFVVGSGITRFDKWINLATGGDRLSVRSRVDVLMHSPRTYLHRPLLGAGPGCFHLAYQQERPSSSDGDGYMNVAHNDYLQWLVETGLIGLGLWLALLGLALRWAWISTQAPAGAVAASIAAVFAIGTYQLFNFATPLPAGLFWMAGCLGLCSTHSGRKKKEGEAETEIPVASTWLTRRAWVQSLLLLGFGVSAALFGWRVHQNQQDVSRAAGHEQLLAWESAYAALDSARDRLPQDTELLQRRAKLADKAFFFSGKPVWLEREKTALLEARASSPRDLDVLKDQADFLERMREYPAAAEVLKQGHEFAPYNRVLRLALAKSAIMQGDFSGAVQEILSIDKAQGTERAILATLLSVVEIQEPGKGVETIQLLMQTRRELGLEVGILAAKAAAVAQPKAATALVAVVLEAKPEAPEQLFELSEIEGRLGQTKQQLALLDKIRSLLFGDSEDQVVIAKAWRSWSEIHLKKGKLDLVAAQLEEYLIKRPRENWARFKLGEILDNQGKVSEARTALRNGLPYDTDGLVRVNLGDLYHKQKLDDIARGYYEDALPLVKDRDIVQQKLDQLKKTTKEAPPTVR